MVSESENYAAGRSGVGGANYASAGWRAGDLERARLQRENAAARNQASLPQPATSSSSTYSATQHATSSGGTYSDSGGGGFTFFSVLVFVAGTFYGIVTAMDFFIPNIRQTILPYIGPEGIVSKNVFFWGVVAILTVVGVLIRRILRWIVGAGILIAIVIGIVRLYMS